MAPIRYSLHYEDYSEHLMSRFGKLLQMQSLVDMTLMCSSHTLRVHKAVLAASSAYFQEVLQKQSGEPLIILKMRFSVLKCLVEFMYCGKTQCLEENLDDLVSAAQFLKIKGLSKVTKEGLGITNQTLLGLIPPFRYTLYELLMILLSSCLFVAELPVFTPPVVINRPPQSLLDLHTQDTNISSDPKPPPQPPQMVPATSTSQAVDSVGRTNKDMVLRIPFDIDNGSTGGVEFSDSMKPRRGRPSIRQRGRAWDSSGPLGRAAERALLRREQDSRKAIHQLKHLQSRQMQDYIERMTLSQAVNSICAPESSTPAHNYINMDNDLMYMDQTVSSNVLDPTISYSKESMANETITSSYSTASTNPHESNEGISNAMSQYVNALKSAGLPTDLPILFESGDGSYINVNEQVLLDMVQSSEIQYEVIEQPNIIEKVADPSEIKSIDDLSKSIERGEMMMGSKPYPSNNYSKDTSQYSRHEDPINSLNSILPDDLDSFAEQQNFVVLDPRLQESNNMDQSNDFSCIDGDMQFFTKSMSDDVKKYYEEQQLNDSRVLEQLCPTSTTMDTSFSISLLDTKSSHLNENIGQQYNPLNSEDLRRNEDCYDFGLQLSQTTGFKEDTLDCLMSTPKHSEDNQKHAQERDELIKDLMNIESNISQNNSVLKPSFESHVQDFNDTLNVDAVFKEADTQDEMQKNKEPGILTDSTNHSDLQWDNVHIRSREDEQPKDMSVPTIGENEDTGKETDINSHCSFDTVIDLTDQTQVAALDLDENQANKENVHPENRENNFKSAKVNDIPFAVGLLPLKQMQQTDNVSLLKRKSSIEDFLDNVDANCLKRKVKYKKL